MTTLHRQANPPGPPLPSLAQTALFFLLPFQFLHDCQRRYGDLFTLRIMGFKGRIVYIADIEAIREVFAADGAAGHAGEANTFLRPVTGAHSLLVLDREEHLRERRLISPALHGETLARARSDIAEIAAEEEATWPSEHPFALRPALQRITFRVIVQLIMNVEEAQTITRLLGLLEPVFNVSPTVLLPPLQRDLGPHSPWGRFRRAREHLDQELLSIVAKRRAQAPGEDLLSLLVHGTDPAKPRSAEQARDELVTLLIAGHETSATALAWAFERLARHPHTLALARDAAEHDDQRYLTAVAQETLRVRPVVMDVARVLDQPLTIGGYQLSTGTLLMPSIELVHTDERNHRNAGAFQPERFLENKPDSTTWFPFGGGRRRCAGAAFAMLEIQTILQVILSRRTLQAPDPAPERQVLRGITFTPHRNAYMALPRVHGHGPTPYAAHEQPISQPSV